MPRLALPQERIDWILSEVKRVGSTYRKPDGNEPRTWNRQAQRRRFGGAYPRDLGASRREQSITRDMHRMADLGYLDRVKGVWFPAFVVAKRPR